MGEIVWKEQSLRETFLTRPRRELLPREGALGLAFSGGCVPFLSGSA